MVVGRDHVPRRVRPAAVRGRFGRGDPLGGLVRARARSARVRARALVGVRALRIPVLYKTVGAVLFAAIVSAAWLLGVHAIRGPEARQRLALAGTLLLVPVTLHSLLWIGLGAPYQATPVENRMRFLVLLVDSIAITGGFVVLWETLREAGERFYSTLGSATNMLAGAAYLIWMSFTLGMVVVRVEAGQTPLKSGRCIRSTTSCSFSPAY